MSPYHTSAPKSVVIFSFSEDVQAWTVNVLGTSHDTGQVADNGGGTTAGTVITAEVDWTELYQEGQNRINIYGQDLNGNWSSYEG
ncbi:hypothetical protein [Cytobacillus sp. IB215665]|uniref:hypothetical protein n=1 Tax=Cytobacillus sp. IB215665 TaxID=3097357 RepID=UPI002A0C6737|nr:hypothetical protein [Cytobacillus sp. IB215665]MDX8365490.1 hypothetical protein [Cytobacillus sp. IB215665]